MKEYREKADLVVHLVGENEIERAYVRQVLETVTEPRLEVIDFAPDSATHHPAKPDVVLVQIEEISRASFRTMSVSSRSKTLLSYHYSSRM